AETLGLEEVPNQSPLTSLTDFLRNRDVLLVLDNFEQVLPAAVELGQLLYSCSTLKILVTSRTVLHVYGEHEFGVPSLALPEGRPVPAPDWLLQYEASALFMQRARAVKEDLQFTGSSATAVAEICATSNCCSDESR